MADGREQDLQECRHEIVLNGACFFCGETDLDGLALSPKPAEQIVPATRLGRRRKAPGESTDE